MSRDHAMDEALRAFAEQPVPPLPTSDAVALRRRVAGRIDAVRQATIDARLRADRRRPWLVFAAAACLPVLAWGAMHRAGQDVRSERKAGVAVITDVRGHATIRGDEVSTGPDDAARAGLPTGAVADVGASSRAIFLASSGAGGQGDLIELATGRVQVSVPKLGAGRDLRVHTAQATVVVHGTKFVVEVLPGETRVSVVEGIVEVDGDARTRMLTAGMSVTVPDARTTPALPSVESHPAARPEASDPNPSARTDAASTLASENALLADAMHLRQKRRMDSALDKLDELLSRHPGLPLAETARVERLRVLQDTGNRERVVREGESYLADYPQGFARAEVVRMLAAAGGHGP